MSLTNIYLARHGETEYNRRNQIQGRGIDAPLNKRGTLQARAIAHFLEDVSMGQIVSSSLQRSRQTAEVIAKQKGLKITSYSQLDEMDFGILEGKPIADIKADLNQLHKKWKTGNVDYAPTQGESPTTVLARAAECSFGIFEENQHENILLVLHGRLIRILLSDWLGFGLSKMYQIPHSNGALYQLRWDGKAFKSLYLNKTDHLSAVDIKQEVATQE